MASQSDLLMEYFKKHPNQDIKHPEIVDWATAKWEKRHNVKLRDADRAIRKLHSDGLLIKVKKGVYRYEPDSVKKRHLEDFNTKTKKAIFERDGYKCVICGRGLKEGMELHADHRTSKDDGGKATLDNGQTLCSQHNIMKKRYGTYDFLGKYSEKTLAIAKKHNDTEVINLFEDLLKVIKKHKAKAEGQKTLGD